jgi:GT2 family glycosyltransferase
MSVVVSIIIVSYNAREELVQCLTSLKTSPPAAAHEIVVVDNASSDGSPGAARNCGVRVIESARNIGFARASNLGIRATSSEDVLLLNSDTIVPPGAVDGILDELHRHPGVAVVGPRLVDADGRAELSFGAMIGPLNELLQKWRVRGNVEGLTRTKQSPDWVSGACLLVRRRDAENAGLLDERYFMYAEDVDFCAAIRASGRGILFVPTIEVIHLRGRSRRASQAATEAAYRRSQIAFYEKHHPRWAPLLRTYLRLRGRI